jgi:4-amino-4-deoxy-L-arabinose transferase-like glycosyltransferase
VLSGLILATIREFTHYATAPECDLFLCAVITTAMTLLVFLEFRCPRTAAEKGFLWGRRPWALLAFFVVLGLCNLVKGLFFGDLLIAAPMAAWLLLGGDRWSMIRRYVWLPGWLAFVVASSAWATAAWLRYPDVVDLWKADYLGRLNEGYMGEPVWYYPLQLPWVLFPWSLPAFLGLWLTRDRLMGGGRTPEQFLWCWALAPILVLSIPEGKHHHYLLHVLVPWAILAGLGTMRLLDYLPTVAWLRTPWPALLVLAVPGEIALGLLVPRYPVPAGLLPAMLVACPLAILGCWWIVTCGERVRACTALFALLLAGHWLGHLHPVLIERRYLDDLEFLEQVRDKVPAKAPLLVLGGKGPLDASWLLYYLEGRGKLLHNLTFLRDKRIDAGEVYLIARGIQVRNLREYGKSELLARSNHSHDQIGPDDRYQLYRLRFHDHLVRHEGPIYISPMQAAGRSRGPELR